MTEITGGPVHVVITLRPIYKIVPSQWQQFVQNGFGVPYDKWPDGMSRRPPYDQPTPSSGAGTNKTTWCAAGLVSRPQAAPSPVRRPAEAL